MPNELPNFIFFGTSQFSVLILDALFAAGYKPSLIVTTPDMPKGRKLVLTAPESKVWAKSKGVPCFQPANLKDEAVIERLKEEASRNPLFVVASYGKIIPSSILAIPKEGCVNIHPSLLPRYRGPSPIQSQIIANDSPIGTSIMLMDQEVDHGPLLGQKEIAFPKAEDELVDSYALVEKKLAEVSASLFLEVLPAYLNDKNSVVPQEHNKATFTKMIEKSDGLLDLKGDPRLNYRKYLAYKVWPGTHFFTEDKRILIKEASFKNGEFIISRVLPEGKNEMPYEDFLKGL